MSDQHAPIATDARPRRPHGVRLVQNEAHGGWVLLTPERVFKADAIAVEIIKRCTGRPWRRLWTILQQLIRRRASACWLTRSRSFAGLPTRSFWNSDVAENGSTALQRPLGLLAELTHRCPLGCPYCSNPLALDSRDDELDAATWARVFREAAALSLY